MLLLWNSKKYVYLGKYFVKYLRGVEFKTLTKHIRS